jgi:aspartate kinase
MRVLKFGGTSIGDAERIRAVVDIVNTKRGQPLVLVFSATASTTDRLEEVAAFAAEGTAAESLTIISEIEKRHLALAGQILAQPARRQKVIEVYRQRLANLREMARSVAFLSDLSPTVRARILGVGELLSSLLMWATLEENGLGCDWVDARELIVTDGLPLAGEPLLADTTSRCRDRLLPLLTVGRAVVTQGFIARSATGGDTTLGRGGSDFTAALIGAALECQEIEIWTDVDGVMTADPSVVPEARLIPEMSFKEAAELAFYGARVLHPRTLVPAVERNIPVRVMNTWRPDSRGTLILAETTGNGRPIKSIAYKEGMTLINLTSAKMFRAHGFLTEVFAVFDRYGLTPDVVATSEVSIAVALWNPSHLSAVLADLAEVGRVEHRTGQAVVCVVGEKLKETPGIVSEVFDDLRDVKTSLVSLGGSEINLSFVVDESALGLVVNRLHRRFFETRHEAAREDIRHAS